MSISEYTTTKVKENKFESVRSALDFVAHLIEHSNYPDFTSDLLTLSPVTVEPPQYLSEELVKQWNLQLLEIDFPTAPSAGVPNGMVTVSVSQHKDSEDRPCISIENITIASLGAVDKLNVVYYARYSLLEFGSAIELFNSSIVDVLDQYYNKPADPTRIPIVRNINLALDFLNTFTPITFVSGVIKLHARDHGMRLLK